MQDKRLSLLLAIKNNKLAETTLQPILDIPFTVKTATSDFAVGATLKQNG